MNDVMVKCLFEFIGTAILVLFGDGVVACTTLKKSKGENAGWVVITLAWGLAVMLGLAAAGTFSWSLVVPYIVAQMLGGFVGAVLVYIFYKDHYDATSDAATKLGTFCTIPVIRNYGRNLLSEIIGTFVLVFVILALSIDGNTSEVGMGALGAFPVAMLIVALGMSLGGTTGYAINPARDLAPRLAHAILPIKGKGPSDWGYSWVPVVGPIIGGFLAAVLYCVIYCY